MYICSLLIFGDFALLSQLPCDAGRMAMMGLINLFAYSAITQKPMLDVINEWVGGAYY